MTDELDAIRQSAARFTRRPRVFFEEWHDPLISGIRWVEELVEIAGGETLFPHLRHCQAAKDRILDPAEVASNNPEVIIGSWCGRQVKKQWIRERASWANVSAVRDNHLYEVKSTYILQPGPAALTEGVRQIHNILAHVMGAPAPESLQPREKVDAALKHANN